LQFTSPITIIGTDGSQNGFLDSLLSTGLMNFPILDQPNNQNVATQTPSTTYQESPATPTPTATPTPSPTPTPVTSSSSSSSSGPNTYTNSDNGTTVTVNNGSTFYVKLSCPGNGDWGAIDELDVTNGLTIINEQTLPVSTGGLVPIVGGGDICQYEIQAISPGIQTIKCPRKNDELTVDVM